MRVEHKRTTENHILEEEKITPRVRWQKAIRRVLILNKFSGLNKEIKVENTLFGRAKTNNRKDNSGSRCVSYYFIIDIYIYIYKYIYIYIQIICIANSAIFDIPNALEHYNDISPSFYSYLCANTSSIPRRSFISSGDNRIFN